MHVSFASIFQFYFISPFLFCCCSFSLSIPLVLLESLRVIFNVFSSAEYDVHHLVSDMCFHFVGHHLMVWVRVLSFSKTLKGIKGIHTHDRVNQWKRKMNLSFHFTYVFGSRTGLDGCVCVCIWPIGDAFGSFDLFWLEGCMGLSVSIPLSSVHLHSSFNSISFFFFCSFIRSANFVPHW